MPRFEETQIAEIKSRIDIIDLISSYGIQVSRTGQTAKCKCPFHNEKTPSFSIDANKGLYYCFGCGEAGDIIKFVEKQEGIDFPSAVKKLASQCGITITESIDPRTRARSRIYSLMAELAQFYHRCLASAKEAELARNYCTSRNLPQETQEAYLIGYAPKSIKVLYKWANKYGYTEEDLSEAGIIKISENGGNPYYYFGGRLVFTVKDKAGRVVAFSGRQLVEDKKSGKYVNSPETLVFKKGRVLFGFDKASSHIVKSPNREVIICEGQIDCIRLQTMGFGNAVASQGTAFTEEHAKMLKRVADTAVLCFDDDSAGHKATVKTAEILLSEGIPVRVVNLPDGDDPDTFLQTKGTEAFREMLASRAESIVAFQVRTERAKEINPSAIDAMTRVSNAVIATIAKCNSSVLRANLMKEASSLLDIDKKDLADELKDKIADEHEAAVLNANEVADDIKQSISAKAIEVTDAAEAFVSDSEIPLIQFIMHNEGDEFLKHTVKSLFPQYVFKSRFCRDIIQAWTKDSTEGQDPLARCIEQLSELDYQEFISAMYHNPYVEVTSLSPAKAVFFYARHIWIDYLVSLASTLGAENKQETRGKVEELAGMIANMVKYGRQSMITFAEKFDEFRYLPKTETKETRKLDMEVQKIAV